MTNDDIDSVWPEAQQRLVDLLPNTPKLRSPTAASTTSR